MPRRRPIPGRWKSTVVYVKAGWVQTLIFQFFVWKQPFMRDRGACIGYRKRMDMPGGTHGGSGSSARASGAADRRWVKVEGARLGPAPVCSLCGRLRSSPPPGSDLARFGEWIFRRLRVTEREGAVQDVTVCGACFETHLPPDQLHDMNRPSRIRRKA